MGSHRNNSATDKQLLLRLYIAGAAPHSVRAYENLRSSCERYLAGRHQLEVVDVLVEPKRALADGVLVTPTLIKFGPGARKMIVGDLREEPALLSALGLEE